MSEPKALNQEEIAQLRQALKSLPPTRVRSALSSAQRQSPYGEQQRFLFNQLVGGEQNDETLSLAG